MSDADFAPPTEEAHEPAVLPDLDRYLEDAANAMFIRNAGGGWFVAHGANANNDLVALAFDRSDTIGAVWERLHEHPHRRSSIPPVSMTSRRPTTTVMVTVSLGRRRAEP